MKFQFGLWIVFCAQIMTSYGQSSKVTISEFYPYKNEIGINFTNVLGNVLSLNPNNASSPYGISYRRHNGSSSFRSAFHINVTNKEENDFTNGNFVIRTLSEKMTEFRIGFEKHLVLSNRMLFSYGFDVLGLIKFENSEIDDFNFPGGITFTSDEKTFGGGLGPVLRLEFKISDRIFISSECSLYGFYSKTEERLVIGGQPNESSESSDSS
ncbi:MAG: hypothetical protein H7X99_07520, partial [Saprospiraceae bacterium]|nr:hypothetical protein [Saprospiraceae bacterium]